LAAKHDFVGLTGTQETEERRSTIDHHILNQNMYFSSYIDQFKGGISLVIKRTFIQRFFPTTTNDNWQVIAKGRVARLMMEGPHGRLHIYVVYFDPSCKTNQIDCISAISAVLDPLAHSLILGDFNFVENASDRFIKETATWSLGQDGRVAKAWASKMTSKGITEWSQDELTCETGICLSRIDRVYSSLHASFAITGRISTTALERPLDISDHRPVSFGLQLGRKTRRAGTPSWILQHPDFTNEVTQEFDYMIERTSGAERPFNQLAVFKHAVRSAAEIVRRRHRNQLACSTQARLSASIGFLRALNLRDWKAANKFQKIYGRLLDVECSPQSPASPAYKLLLEHVSELAQTNVNERIEELRTSKPLMPDFIYTQRKENILSSLRRLLPGSGGQIHAIKDPATGNSATEPSEIARVLTEHWQNTFNGRSTNAELRKQWLDRLANKLNVTASQLLPTKSEIETVLDQLPASSPGPDGIPFEAYKKLKHIVINIFYKITRGMMDGTDIPPEDFNQAILICIPKTEGELTPQGLSSHEASGTRPLSIVDASNRIIASMFRLSLERCTGSWISEAQRGFLKGRQMLRNILDIDLAAQTISVNSTTGAILLFDFRAAFPSIDHNFMWDTLAAIGIPSSFISMLQMFYKNNKHVINVGGQTFDSIEVHSGVRQGCPLSALLFALIADVLLREISASLGEGETVRSFADDTAAVVRDYAKSIPALAKLFEEFEQISALALNIKKTVLIPLWPITSEANVQLLVREICPAWRNISICLRGKYLGFIIGPGATTSSWDKPLDKFEKRSLTWSSLNLGLHYNMKAYRTFVAPILSFLMQLEPDPPDLMARFESCLRRLAPGPGNWITAADLAHLQTAFRFPSSFRDPRWTSLATKLRVICEVAPDCQQKHQTLTRAQAETFRRPFGKWHDRSFFSILAQTCDELNDIGVTISSVKLEQRRFTHCSFQAAAEKMIAQRMAAPYFPLSRVRAKLMRWHVCNIGDVADRRVLRRFELLSHWCPPRVSAIYLKTLFNGWVTDRRLRSLLQSTGVLCRRCVLGCESGEDSVDHYALCPVFWAFACDPRPGGLGLREGLKSREAFLLVKEGLADADCVRIAVGAYALHRVVQYCRHQRQQHSSNLNYKQMFHIWVRRGSEGSRASRLLR
jgi:hypothetical protein